MIAKINFAQLGGISTYAFLNLPNSARTTALGGYNITTKDAEFIPNNPSLMDSTTANYLTASYINYYAGINWGYSAYSFKPSKYGFFALGMQYINYGKFIAADEIGNITGEFTAADYTMNISWAYKIDSFFTAGINIKPIYSVYETYTSLGIANDLSMSYLSHTNNFIASLILRNIGYQIKPYIEGNHETLPFDIQLGISQKLSHAPFRFSLLAHHINKLDLTYQIPTETDNTLLDEPKQSKISKIAAGTMRHLILATEIIPSKNFHISFAYNDQRRQELKIESRPGIAGFSAGFGLNIKRFTFNYGISKYHLAGTMQNFTISYRLK